MDGEAVVPIDNLRTMEAYNSARDSGATETIDKSELEANEPPKVTGTETTAKEYNEKRDAQQQRSKGGGFQRRIDRFRKEAALEREARERAERRLQEIEGRNGNSNREEPQYQESESETYSAEPEHRRETADPKIASLRQEFGDWDEVMTRAKNENLRVSNEAAAAARSLEHAGRIIYMLASNG